MDDAILVAATSFRRRLHSMPEISGEERDTAAEVVRFLAPTKPDKVITDLGGHGVAMVYEGSAPGPTVLLRSELDALPIQEIGALEHRSRVPGKAHLCGHDGHTATLAAIGLVLGERRAERGRIVLMFQPAEENGAGARAVVADPRFALIRPDISFAYHNAPGIPFGHAWLGVGPVNCASRGMRISLGGRTAHAAEPQNGVSPMSAVAHLMPKLTALSSGTRHSNTFAMATVTHARMGVPAFGIAPGDAEIFVTLRTLVDAEMASLVARAERIAQRVAGEHGLRLDITYEDIFAHVENAPEAVAHLRAVLDDVGVPHSRGDLPFKASSLPPRNSRPRAALWDT